MDRVIASFRQSFPKTLGLVAGGSLLTLASLLIVIHVIPVAPWSKGAIAGYVGLPFFGLATLLLVVRLFQAGPVVEVTTSGISHRRWSQEFIPWSTVAGMSVQQVRRRRSLILRLRPGGSRAISMTGLDGSFEDLLSAVRAAQQGGAVRQPS